VQGRSQRILASKRFEVHQPLADRQVAAVVAGFGAASDQLAQQVINWTLAQGAQAQAKNQ
jgi:cholesterol transport system auxiliary component